MLKNDRIYGVGLPAQVGDPTRILSYFFKSTSVLVMGSSFCVMAALPAFKKPGFLTASISTNSTSAFRSLSFPSTELRHDDAKNK